MLVKYRPSDPLELESEEVSLALSDISTAIAQSHSTIVMMGAGVSTNAGIADFRSKATGLYTRSSPRSNSSIASTSIPSSSTNGPSCSRDNLTIVEPSVTKPEYTTAQIKSYFSASALQNPSSRTKALRFFSQFKTEIDRICQLTTDQKPLKGVTSFHRFLSELKALGKLSRVYSQNIDGFESQSGLKNVNLLEDAAEVDVGDVGETVQLHGSIWEVKCSECNFWGPCGIDIVQEWDRGGVVDCWRCQERLRIRKRLGKRALPTTSYLRPAIVLYDEILPHSETIAALAYRDVVKVDCLLVCGTSLKIGGFVNLVHLFAKEVRAKGGLCILVNREPVAASWDEVFDYHVLSDCDEFVERIKSDWKAAAPEVWRGVKKLQRSFFSRTSRIGAVETSPLRSHQVPEENVEDQWVNSVPFHTSPYFPTSRTIFSPLSQTDAPPSSTSMATISTSAKSERKRKRRTTESPTGGVQLEVLPIVKRPRSLEEYEASIIVAIAERNLIARKGQAEIMEKSIGTLYD